MPRRIRGRRARGRWRVGLNDKKKIQEKDGIEKRSRQCEELIRGK